MELQLFVVPGSEPLAPAGPNQNVVSGKRLVPVMVTGLDVPEEGLIPVTVGAYMNCEADVGGDVIPADDSAMTSNTPVIDRKGAPARGRWYYTVRGAACRCHEGGPRPGFRPGRTPRSSRDC